MKITKQRPVIIFLGRSGSGKGTQAELLMNKFSGFYYISTGDLFRKLAKANSDVSRIIAEVLSRGELPFDDLATTLWMHEVSFNVKEGEGIILDGAPRRVQEAKNLDKFLEFMGRLKNTRVLYIDVSKEEAVNRLLKRRICTKCGFLVPWLGDYKNWTTCNKCGGLLKARGDDKLEAIEGRMEFFKKAVVPTVKYYEKQNRLIKINGEQGIDKIFQDIVKMTKLK